MGCYPHAGLNMTAVEGGRASQNLGGGLSRTADCPQSAARGQSNPLEKFRAVWSGTVAASWDNSRSVLRRRRTNERVWSFPRDGI